jgi:hypothetical protein
VTRFKCPAQHTLYSPRAPSAAASATLLYTVTAHYCNTMLPHAAVAHTAVAHCYGTLLLHTAVALSYRTLLPHTAVANSYHTLLLHTAIAHCCCICHRLVDARAHPPLRAPKPKSPRKLLILLKTNMVPRAQTFLSPGFAPHCYPVAICSSPCFSISLAIRSSRPSSKSRRSPSALSKPYLPRTDFDLTSSKHSFSCLPAFTAFFESCSASCWPSPAVQPR